MQPIVGFFSWRRVHGDTASDKARLRHECRVETTRTNPTTRLRTLHGEAAQARSGTESCLDGNRSDHGISHDKVAGLLSGFLLRHACRFET